MKARFVHRCTHVLDKEATIAFYEQALGFHVDREKGPADGSWTNTFMVNDESPFELELTWLAEHPQKYDLGEEEFHLAFRADDFDAAHKLHEEMGCIAFENHDMGIYFITDPDGYWLEIIPD